MSFIEKRRRAGRRGSPRIWRAHLRRAIWSASTSIGSSGVLIDEPEAFAVYRDDEAGADLAERLEVGDLVGMRKRCGSVAVGAGKICGPVRSGQLSGEAWGAEGCAWFEGEALLAGLQRRGAQIEAAVGAHATA